jgi:hypothetical protein
MGDPKDQRNPFSKEQDRFISYLMSHFQYSSHDQLFWKKISETFNQQFPNSRRSGRTIKNHYNNVIIQNLRRGQFCQIEEQIFIQYLHKYGCTFKKISKLMDRTENSLKNYYYRNLQKVLSKEEIIIMNSNSRQTKNMKAEIKTVSQQYQEDCDHKSQENIEIPISQSFELTRSDFPDPTCYFENEKRIIYILKNSDLIEFSFQHEDAKKN